MNRQAEAVARRSVRIALALDGSLIGRSPRSIVVKDLSVRGCLVESPVSPSQGTILDLKVCLGDGELRTKARVVYASLDGTCLPGSTRYLVGLEFVGIAAEEEARLRAFIDEERRRGGT